MSDFTSFDGLITAPTLLTLIVLIGLQVVVGLFNLLYISMESRRVDTAKQRRVRHIGIGCAVGWIFVALLITYLTAIGSGSGIVLNNALVSGQLTPFSILLWFGVGITIWTIARELFHLLLVDHLEHAEAAGARSASRASRALVLSTAKFAVLSMIMGLALSDRLAIIVLSVIIASGVMIWLSDHATRLIEKHRGLMVLSLLVMLIASLSGLGLAASSMKLQLFGADIAGLSRGAFYILTVLITLIAFAQRGYRKRLLSARDEAARVGIPTTEPGTGAAANR